jgi:Holliday junction resolvasome RuvABC ATP-dependent DNA helicase subunit
MGRFAALSAIACVVTFLANGYVLFIDELHDNLYPRLVQLFHNSEANPRK